ncbi:hypothetical protein L7F22_006821 [Adiantum nelumboides]|nr:hypothetical protein [Adiantum nelumboides]
MPPDSDRLTVTTGAAFAEDVAHEIPDLFSTDGAEGLEALGGEEFGGANQADETPIGARLGGADVAMAVDEGIGSGGEAGGKEVVVGLENLAGGGGGGGDDGRDGAEAEGEEGAMLLAELEEDLMGVLAKEVEVANEGEARGARGQPEAALSSSEEEEKNGRKQECYQGEYYSSAALHVVAVLYLGLGRQQIFFRRR